tara:strand:- start:210 stop:776 length:567 start_codon:yes stop_codon:yes gene_type:complete
MKEIEALSQLKFSPIVFDGKKYKDHVEAVKNEDFIKLDLDYDYSISVGYFQSVYYNANNVFNSLKSILKSEYYKLVLPYYHLDLNDDQLLQEISEREREEYDDDEEEGLINVFYEILKSNFFVIKNKDKIVGKDDFYLAFEKFVIEDLKGNLKINNQKLIDIVNIIKEKGVDLDSIKNKIKADNIESF